MPAPTPASGSAPHEIATVPMSPAARVGTLIAILGPLAGLAVAAALFWGRGFTWVDLGLLVGMYLLTALGITVGYHRLFVHRSFETNIAVKFVLAALGSMAVQGSLLKWVALHRRHHQHSDEVDDPHTPHHQGPGLLGWLRGYWRSYIGWLFEPEPAGLSRYVPDLEKSRVLRMASTLFPLWIAVGLAIPAALGGLLSRTWAGAWTGFIWGGLVRIFLVHHVTWSVNSACHLWGRRTYRSGDESRDNAVYGVLALGEGWHNTHHAFPTSARHGLRWWQIDFSYGVIRALAFVGLAWDVKLPSKRARAERETRAESGPGGLSPGSRQGLCRRPRGRPLAGRGERAGPRGLAIPEGGAPMEAGGFDTRTRVRRTIGTIVQVPSRRSSHNGRPRGPPDDLDVDGPDRVRAGPWRDFQADLSPGHGHSARVPDTCPGGSGMIAAGEVDPHPANPR